MIEEIISGVIMIAVVFLVLFIVIKILLPFVSKFLGIDLSSKPRLSESEKKELLDIEKSEYLTKCKELAKKKGEEKAYAKYKF